MKPGFYKQIDSRWATYAKTTTDGGKPTIGAHGCGPTTCSNVLSVIKSTKWTPKKLFSYACKNGLMTASSGLYWSGIKSMLKHGGISEKDIKQTNSDAEAKKALENGKWVIALMGPGNWTKGGHFVLAYSIKNGYVYVSDPASYATGRAKAKWSLMAAQNLQYWIVDISKYSASAKKVKWSKRLAKTKSVSLYTNTAAVIRSGPAKSYKKVGAVKKNKALKLKKLNANWYYICKGKYVGNYVRATDLAKYKYIDKTYEVLFTSAVRSGYSGKADKLCEVKKGKHLVSKKQRGNWAYISKQAGCTKSGWVRIKDSTARYLKKL